MAAETSTSWKIIDIVMAVAVFLTLLAATYSVYNETHMEQLSTAKDVSLFRSTAQVTPHTLQNATVKFPETLALTIVSQGKCDVQVKNAKKNYIESCFYLPADDMDELIIQPNQLEKGEYKINVLK